MLLVSADLAKYYVEGSDFLTVLLFGISDYGHVTIYGDQWFGVDAWAYNPETKKPERVGRIQCDDPLDGLCGAYLLLRQRAGIG